MLVPCLPTPALHLLAGTADERYALSPDYFRATHFPQTLHRVTGSSLQKWTEAELLDDLTSPTTRTNRVYAVLGSTGSGKSELLCWIKDQWQQLPVDRPVIRISRTELNPQKLVQKCYQTLGYDLDVPFDESRWDLLFTKPITIVNQMVWSALSDLYEQDAEIVPLAMLIRPIVETNLSEFAKQLASGKVVNSPELLSYAQFSSLQQSTSLHFTVEYPTLRQVLIQKFDHFLFHGQDMVTWMRKLSERLLETKVRPLLLIDDLVQSVNLYASELVDAFMTLEEGNWDVVLGLTPGALQDSEKGRGLVHRFFTLDTIDDRVTKLWLSDEAGQSFYTLQKEQAVPYLRTYLMELKTLQGFSCSHHCPHSTACAALHGAATQEELALAPLNKAFLHRLYEGIPAGKGKLRYLIQNLKEVIRQLNHGQARALDRINSLVKKEFFSDHPDKWIKHYAEWFAEPSVTTVEVSSVWLAHFGVTNPSTQVQLRQISKVQDLQPTPHSPDLLGPIRDWVEGKPVNQELLEPIRLGIATIMQDVTKATSMSRPYTSRPSAALQKTAIENRVRYPLSFSSANGIEIQRDSFVFDIAGFQKLRPQEKATRFVPLAQDARTAQWIYQAQACQKGWLQQVESVLGMTLCEFAYRLRDWCLRWKTVSFPDLPSPVQQIWLDRAEELFADWFLLRDNLIDRRLYEDAALGNFSFDKWLAGFTIRKECNRFHVLDVSLADWLLEVQEGIAKYRTQLLNRSLQVLPDWEDWYPFLKHYDRTKAEQLNCILRKANLFLEDFECLFSLIRWCQQSAVSAQYREVYALHTAMREAMTAWEKHFRLIQRHIPKLKGNLPSIEPSWDIAIASEQLSSLEKLVAEQQLFLETITTAPVTEEIFQMGKKAVSGQTLSQREVLHLQKWAQLGERGHLLHALASDLHWPTIEVETWNQHLLADPHLRSRVKNHVVQLIETGRSTLPEKQGKGIFEELRAQCPTLTRSLRVQLVPHLPKKAPMWYPKS